MSHYQKQAKAKCSFSSTRPLGTSTRGGALRIVHELESDTTRDARHSPPTQAGDRILHRGHIPKVDETK